MGNLSLDNYETDYWVAHTCYPSFNGKNRISYRLHHIVVPSPTHVHAQPTYAVFFEEQECRASFNDCVRWTFAPAYHFTWKGPILVMKINSSDSRVADCTEMDLENIREIIKMYVLAYFYMLIALLNVVRFLQRTSSTTLKTLTLFAD